MGDLAAVSPTLADSNQLKLFSVIVGIPCRNYHHSEVHPNLLYAVMPLVSRIHACLIVFLTFLSFLVRSTIAGHVLHLLRPTRRLAPLLRPRHALGLAAPHLPRCHPSCMHAPTRSQAGPPLATQACVGAPAAVALGSRVRPHPSPLADQAHRGHHRLAEPDQGSYGRTS